MYKSRPVIAVMPLYDEEKDSVWMLPQYLKALKAQRAIPIIPSLYADKAELDMLLEICDGFLLTGGQDVNPFLYGEELTDLCGETSERRDFEDSYVLQGAVAADKPVLGICRGIQLMNAVYGGTLYQDIAALHPSETQHRMAKPYDKSAHSVTLSADSPLFKLLGKDKINVNSCHHQAVKTVSPYFKGMAYSPDGICEAIYMPDKRFIWGVQWHPELSYLKSDESLMIIRQFVAQAQANSGK